MKTEKLTKDQALAYLRLNKDLLKLNNIGKIIGVTPSVITRAVNNKPDSAGYPVTLPDHCIPKLEQLIKDRLIPLRGFLDKK